MTDSEPFPNEAQASLEVDRALQAIARHAATPAGKARLLAAQPQMELRAREARLARGEEALQAVYAEHAPGITGACDLADLLQQAGHRVLEGEELIAVAEMLELMQRLSLWASQRPQYSALGYRLADAPVLRDLRESLRASLGRRGEVLDEAHPELGRARRRITKLRSERGKLMEKVAESLHKQGVLRQRQAVQRGDRLLLAVRATHAGRAKGVVHDRSQSGDTLFVEPGPVLELSNRLVEAQSAERRIIEEVLRQLTRAVLLAEHALLDVEDRLADTDLAFACGRWAAEQQANYPTFGGSVLELREARHPLLVMQMGHDAVIPLTLELGRDHELLVVTGPNTGGKTVVLKTVGILASLAMSGLPITAGAGSQVPALAGLHADIGDAQSLESSLSTFSGHLSRTLQILQAVKPGCLVLLDELGTGTDPEEGAAIGQAVLEALMQAGALAIANTHLGQLKLFSTDVARAENASMEFDPESLAPKYRLLVGVPGASHAVEVAERLGLPHAILLRARELAEREGGAEKLLADVGRVRRDAEELRERARGHEADARDAADRIEADREIAEYRAELRQAEAEQAFVEHSARLQLLLEERAKPLLSRARGQEKADWTAVLEQIDGELRACELGERWRSFVSKLKKGEMVYVPRFRERLQVMKLHRNRETVKLRHGNLEVELPWRDITWVQPPPG